MKLNINQKTYDIPDNPPRPLLWILRDELGLTGTKYGCGVGICGSCTVILNGEAVRTCTTISSALPERVDIITIEGLAQDQPDGSLKLHPVQEAFIEWQAPQCSWCMSGQMMTAAAFLEKNPKPTEEEIVAAMSQNYCRCGCYFRVRNAVARAAEIAAEERA